MQGGGRWNGRPHFENDDAADGVGSHARRGQNLSARGLEEALARRGALAVAAAAVEPTTAFRLFHRAADGDPGLAIDAYDRFLVVHLFDGRAPSEEHELRTALSRLGFEGAYLKRHPRQKNELVDARGDTFAPSTPWWGQAAPETLVVHEHGLPFGVRLGDGLRTGLFLDQRDNRQRVRQLADGRRVLNLFSYTGGFAVAALKGGAAHVLCVDSSSSALARARENVARVLGHEPSEAARAGASAAGPEQLQHYKQLCDDAFDVLRRLHRRGQRFDVVIVDPPSYSSTRSRRFRARKDYLELCRACLRVLEPGGSLLACTNHHETSWSGLRGFVEQAAAAEGRALLGCRRLASGIDFPIAADASPELKSLLTRVS
jgi:23S rRNA (cytosine1962-C5)-methyltransferase